MNQQLEIGAHVGPKRTIEADFWEFHHRNPIVYNGLVRLARKWRERRGTEKLGIGMLFEVLRWDLAISTEGDAFKLNNNYRSYYARLIMTREPDLEGVFETRRLNAPEPFPAASRRAA
jgi:hypothetical protein